METSVDEFSFHNLGVGGKEIHLVKYIHQKRIEDYLEASKLKAYEQPKPAVEKPAEKISYRVKLMEPHQAIEISQCAYRTYGYNYISEFIYYPERVVEMNRRGELISAVAVTDDTNEVMGHAALELDAGRSLAELGVAFTKPQFRNQGCFNRIADYFLSIIKERGRKGAYARAVTIHPYSQKTLLRNGFKECGLILGLAPATIFEKYSGSGKQRESVVVLFLNLDYRSAVNLYSPRRHRKILEKIYANSEIPVQWADSKSTDKNMLSGRRAVIDTAVNSSLMNAIISVRKYGENTLDEIRFGLKRLTREKLDTIQLYLDLGDPFTAILAKDFEKMGFFFAGILPTDSRHNLILQYLNNIYIDYSLISTASDFASELLSYIRSCDPNV